jgi:hypothetical protein
VDAVRLVYRRSCQAPVQHSAADTVAVTTLDLGGNWRSVREDAPLQNQFGKTSRAGRAGVEQERRCRALRVRDEGQFFEVKIGIGNARVISRPALRHCRNDRAQNFTALDSRGLRWRLGRLGMKRTRALRRVSLRNKRAKCAVIRNRDPRKDRDGNGDASRGRPHVG